MFAAIAAWMGRATGMKSRALSVGLIAFASTIASAEPLKTIKLVVPLPAGGAGDIVARLIAEQITRTGAANVVVESRSGAGSIVGTESVARAAPDGGTLLINAPYLLIGPQVRKLGYEPLTSFEPLCKVVSSPGVIVVNGEAPYRSLTEFLDAARANPGGLTMASVGPATAQHLGLEMLNRDAKVSLTYVPYPGGAPAINALLGGHVTSVLAELAPLSAHLNSGALRALATTGRERIKALPLLPTVAESGYRDYEVDLWWGFFAPAGTPKAIVSQLNAWLTAAVEAPEINQKLTAQGFSPARICGPEFRAMLSDQYQMYSRVIRESNIGAE
jgi:tripartite-type tricarboxylate transporter receptor subunit TctC